MFVMTATALIGAYSGNCIQGIAQGNTLSVHVAIVFHEKPLKKWARSGSNGGPSRCDRDALPTEPRALQFYQLSTSVKFKILLQTLHLISSIVPMPVGVSRYVN